MHLFVVSIQIEAFRSTDHTPEPHQSNRQLLARRLAQSQVEIGP